MQIDLTGRHIDNNFYRVTDAEAGALAREQGKPLPKVGWEMVVDVGGKKAWLTRTETQHTPGFERYTRGWVWAIHPHTTNDYGRWV
jgi:hypothetical protein